MLRFSIICLYLCALSGAEAVTLTLERASSYALAHNPTLAAARLRIDEARGRLLAAGRLANPELEIEFSHNTRTPERSMAASLMQRFPVTARLRLEKTVSRAQLAAAEAEVRDAERKLTAEVRTAALRYVALRMQSELRQQQLATSREQTEFVRKRVQAAEASAIDALQLDLETRQLETELLQLETTRAALDGELRPLLGVSVGERVEITGTLAAPGRLPAQGTTGAHRPDLDAARHHAEAARHSMALAAARRWEDIGVGLTGGGERTEDVPEGLSNDYFLGFRFSVPLPLWNRNEGRIAETKAAAERAEKEVGALALSIRSEAEAARDQMAAFAKLIVEMDGALLPKAAEVEAQLRASYGTGQTPLTEVLRARSRRLELTQRRVDALRDYHLARARYESAIGSSGK